MLCTASVGSILLHAALSLGLGNGIIVVYDTTDAETFEHVSWPGPQCPATSCRISACLSVA